MNATSGMPSATRQRARRRTGFGVRCFRIYAAEAGDVGRVGPGSVVLAEDTDIDHLLLLVRVAGNVALAPPSVTGNPGRHPGARQARLDCCESRALRGLSLPQSEDWLYLTVVLDLCTRCVVGWAMPHHLGHELALAALDTPSCGSGPHPVTCTTPIAAFSMSPMATGSACRRTACSPR